MTADGAVLGLPRRRAVVLPLRRRRSRGGATPEPSAAIRSRTAWLP